MSAAAPDARAQKRILLISPPGRTANTSDLALGLLKPLLEAEGLPTDTLHGSLLLPMTIADEGLLEEHANHLFAPLLYPEIGVEDVVSLLVETYTRANTLNGILQPSRHLPGWKRDLANLERSARAAARVARQGLDRCYELASQPRYDIFAFSLTFETQLASAVALARRLKAFAPSAKVVFGGAACFEEQADGMIASFPAIDAVCHTEGEHVIAPLMRALRGAAPLSDVPGIAFRGSDGGVRHTPSPPLFTDLDRLPLPDYDDFARQLADSEWAHAGARLLFETSRGCWWGQKSLCKFCGLNAEGLAFRHKSPERAYQEIRALYERYPDAAYLQAADNILEMSYFATVLPQLARSPRLPGRPLRIFYEIKSNLNKDQVALLADSGIVAVQPGVESFHDRVLKLMDKGATGLGQVQFVKWAYEHGVKTVYNILIRNPGDQAAWYRAMSAMVPYLEHLPPPRAILPFILERFSPYYLEPAAHGITNMRPKPHYAKLFPDPGVDLARLAYQFDFDHSLLRDEALTGAYRELVFAVRRWIVGWRPSIAHLVEREGGAVVVDQRQAARRLHRLSGVARAAYRCIDRARGLRAMRRELAEIHTDVLDCLLDTWSHRRWAVADERGRRIAVLPEFRRRTVAPKEA